MLGPAGAAARIGELAGAREVTAGEAAGSVTPSEVLVQLVTTAAPKHFENPNSAEAALPEPHRVLP